MFFLTSFWSLGNKFATGCCVTKIFIKILYKRIAKAQDDQKLRIIEESCLDERSGIPVIKEVFLPFTVKETMLLQISLVFPLEGCCSNFAPEKAYIQQTSNKTFEDSKPCLKSVLVRISEACQNFGVLVKNLSVMRLYLRGRQ